MRSLLGVRLLDRKIIDYLPEYMREYREIQGITEAEQFELEESYEALFRILDNSFLSDADETGISRYEKILRITALEKDTLEERRFRVQAAFLDYSNYTLVSLKKYLTSILGSDGYEVTLLNLEYKVVVKIILREKDKYDIVNAYLRKSVPANMIIDAYIDFNHNSALKKYTHRELKQWTHKHIRNEVL